MYLKSYNLTLRVNFKLLAIVLLLYLAKTIHFSRIKARNNNGNVFFKLVNSNLSY